MCELEDGLVGKMNRKERKEKRKMVVIIVRDNSMVSLDHKLSPDP